MSDVKDAPAGEAGRSWSDTLLLPKTDFPMRAGLPKREPEILARWKKEGAWSVTMARVGCVISAR